MHPNTPSSTASSTHRSTTPQDITQTTDSRRAGLAANSLAFCDPTDPPTTAVVKRQTEQLTSPTGSNKRIKKLISKKEIELQGVQQEILPNLTATFNFRNSPVQISQPQLSKLYQKFSKCGETALFIEFVNFLNREDHLPTPLLHVIRHTTPLLAKQLLAIQTSPLLTAKPAIIRKEQIFHMGFHCSGAKNLASCILLLEEGSWLRAFYPDQRAAFAAIYDTLTHDSGHSGTEIIGTLLEPNSWLYKIYQKGDKQELRTDAEIRKDIFEAFMPIAKNKGALSAINSLKDFYLSHP